MGGKRRERGYATLRDCATTLRLMSTTFGGGGKRSRLVARREDLGMTQAELAEVAGLAVSTVARIERSEANPTGHSRRRYAAALNLDLATFTQLLDDVGDGEPDDRSPAVGRHGVVAVARLRERVLDLDARYQRTPPAALLADAASCQGEATALRRGTRGRAARDLSVLDGECSILVGQLVWDASQRTAHREACAHFQRAAVAARSVGDRSTESLALLREAIVFLYGKRDPQVGGALAHRAVDTVGGSSHALAGLGILHVAEAHAMMRERAVCEAALGTAEARFEMTRDDDPAIDMVSPTTFGRLAGSCYLTLGDSARAESILRTTAAGFSEPSKPQAIVLGNLALAYTAQANIDAAATAFHDAIDVIELTRGAGGLTIVGRIASELAPWATMPSVRDARERLFTVLRAA